jgi:hypothetical protein
MPGQFWEADQTVDQARPQQAPALRPVLSLPADPLDTQNTTAGIGEKEANVRNVAHDNALQDRTTRITNAQALRKEFYGLPQIATYQTILQNAASALNAESTPTGDQQLITAYAKALDPNSVVREGEFATVADADSAAGRMWAKIQKEGGFDNAGLLRPEVRDRVRRGLVNLANTANQGYTQQRDYFSDLAKRNDLDPVEVVGPDIGAPFMPTIQAFEKKQQGEANKPTNADIYANGVKLNGGLSDGGSFDRDAYLQSIGVDPGKESLVIGFWNANKGNRNLTPDTVRKWYAGQGIPPPDESHIQDAIGHARNGLTFQGYDTTAAQKAYQDNLDAAIKLRGDDPESMTGAVGLNAAQGILLNGVDEASGVGGAVNALAHGKDPIAGYQVERDIIRREGERADAAHPAASLASNIVGSLATAPIGMGEVATVADAAKAGAKIGGVAGFNSGQGAAGSIAGAALGAGFGAVAGAGGQTASEALGARAAANATAAAGAPPSEGAQVIAAADRLNERFGTHIQPLPADVGGPGTRMATGAAATLPLGAPQIVRGAMRVTAEAEKAQQAIAALAGTASTPEGAGEAALKGAQKYIASSKTKVNALYAKARQLGGDEPVDLAGARDVLDQNIAELSQTPGGAPGLATLKNLRAELDKPYPVEGVKRMRTALRDQFLDEGLRGSDLERRVGQVVDAADQDITDSLAAAGKTDAAKAYRAAADAHKERIGVIDTVIAPIIGKNGEKSVEDVLKAIDTASKTKGARLGKFLNSLPPDDASTVRATLISRLGKVSAGRQDAEGTAFSLNDFLTHWNQLSGPAKGQLFGGELRSALDDLAKVAQGTKEAQRFENSSKTGAAVGQLATGALLMRFFTEPMTAAVGFGGQAALGRLLSRPSFARWLAKMPKDPALAQKHIQSLSKIATADASIAPEITGFQQWAARFFGGPGNLSAQPTASTSTTGGGTQ